MDPKPEATASCTLSLNFWRKERTMSNLLHPSSLEPSRTHTSWHTQRSTIPGARQQLGKDRRNLKGLKVGHWRHFIFALFRTYSDLKVFSTSRFSREGWVLPLSSQTVQRCGDIGGCELFPNRLQFGLNIAGRRMHNGDVDPFSFVSNGILYGSSSVLAYWIKISFTPFEVR